MQQVPEHPSVSNSALGKKSYKTQLTQWQKQPYCQRSSKTPCSPKTHWRVSAASHMPHTAWHFSQSPFNLTLILTTGKQVPPVRKQKITERQDIFPQWRNHILVCQGDIATYFHKTSNSSLKVTHSDFWCFHLFLHSPKAPQKGCSPKCVKYFSCS